MVEVERKRQYRVGLNLFNTSPKTGMDYLKWNILEQVKSKSMSKF